MSRWRRPGSTMSWKQIAVVLGDRMENHAYCPEEGHSADAPDLNCPFCHDREAFRLFRERLARDEASR